MQIHCLGAIIVNTKQRSISESFMYRHFFFTIRKFLKRNSRLQKFRIGKLGPAGSKRKTTATVFVQCQFVLWLDCSFCFCSNALGDNGVKAASRILRSKRARVVEITHTIFYSNVSILNTFPDDFDMIFGQRKSEAS